MGGPNSYQWIADRSKVKGGERVHYNNAAYRQWRMAVFQRDGFLCVLCNEKSRLKEAHHIIRYSVCPERQLDVTNGVTLCVDCHRSIKNREEEYESLFFAIVAYKQTETATPPKS